jgi:hypothetical protein
MKYVVKSPSPLCTFESITNNAFNVAKTAHKINSRIFGVFELQVVRKIKDFVFERLETDTNVSFPNLTDVQNMMILEICSSDDHEAIKKLPIEYGGEGTTTLFNSTYGLRFVKVYGLAQFQQRLTSIKEPQMETVWGKQLLSIKKEQEEKVRYVF